MNELENLDDVQVGEKNRPTFLTVLCILTFVGSGIGILIGLFGLVGNTAFSSMNSSANTNMIWTVLSLVASGLCLFGALQMWQLKKMGFTLYILGSIISITATILSAISATRSISNEMNRLNSKVGREYTASQEQVLNTVSSFAGVFLWAVTIFGIIITITFVLMYNANKKHLVN
jgi:hypothetical protein